MLAKEEHRLCIKHLWVGFFISLILVVMLWAYGRDIKLQWANVPPAPSTETANILTLGDDQMAYRFFGLMLQSFGNTSGRYELLTNYNYDMLSQWFDVLYALDGRSNFLPFLVTYYYGATSNKEQLKHVTKFLHKIGLEKGNKRWKWLAQAVYLARYKLENSDYALELALALENHPDPDVDIWARNLRSIIFEGAGEKEAALYMSLSLLKNRGHEMSSQETNWLVGYICEELLEPEKRPEFEICSHMFNGAGE